MRDAFEKESPQTQATVHRKHPVEEPAYRSHTVLWRDIRSLSGVARSPEPCSGCRVVRDPPDPSLGPTATGPYSDHLAKVFALAVMLKEQGAVPPADIERVSPLGSESRSTPMEQSNVHRRNAIAGAAAWPTARAFSCAMHRPRTKDRSSATWCWRLRAARPPQRRWRFPRAASPVVQCGLHA